ncbi:hypothetical protein [Peptostreptococcus russellii]|uniref:Uncharacterized protein n=1 Tax=Peptostreptococcus russellii TaxID=215200 RepID=A0A1H8K4H8_9FIRM|nr:hypothetical protein [Peptostreptococcus russellii]SEN87597.1 hypothetical protein SAMN05216454_1223 [Peptostreptococcus russellii]
MGILSKLFNKKESEYTKYHFTTIPVVGISYKQKEVKKIFKININY